MQQGGEEGALGRGEPDLPAVQLALQDADLVTESEDLGVLGAVAHGQQPRHRQRVRHTEVRQSQQHSPTSWPSNRQRSASTSTAGRDNVPSRSSEWPWPGWKGFSAAAGPNGAAMLPITTCSVTSVA